jgi:NAD-dependent dihydropyrimidine dehydrogenase PreA subunit
MTQFNDRPIPLIDPHLCDGCGLCVHACPTRALTLLEGKAIVANPLACEYSGLCEAVCPTQAITRPFEIVLNVPKDIVKDENESDNLRDVFITASNSTKVVEIN